jgi:hypothetical protein
MQWIEARDALSSEQTLDAVRVELFPEVGDGMKG